MGQLRKRPRSWDLDPISSIVGLKCRATGRFISTTQNPSLGPMGSSMYQPMPVVMYAPLDAAMNSNTVTVATHLAPTSPPDYYAHRQQQQQRQQYQQPVTAASNARKPFPHPPPTGYLMSDYGNPPATNDYALTGHSMGNYESGIRDGFTSSTPKPSLMRMEMPTYQPKYKGMSVTARHEAARNNKNTVTVAAPLAPTSTPYYYARRQQQQQRQQYQQPVSAASNGRKSFLPPPPPTGHVYPSCAVQQSDSAVTHGGIWDVVDGTCLAKRIEDHFNTCMKNDKVSLLKDFLTYSKSLPVKYFRYDYFKNAVEFTPLFKIGYYVQSEDLTAMAEAILDRGFDREKLKYISASSKSGKTASILPAFLRSTSMDGGGSHYLYMAFHNNNERNFTSSPKVPSSDKDIAAKQGAAFMVECVKTLLDQPDDINSYTIKLEESPKLTVEACSRLLLKYLTEKFGENCNILFHLDEHGKMLCDREDLSGNGVDFSRGAMTALACVGVVNVIATYIERPVLLAEGSSGVCRVPIALPSIDVNEIMSIVPELNIDASNFDSDQLRLLASLKLRLGFKFREMDLISVLYHRRSKKSTERFLHSFAEVKKDIQTNATEALQRLNSDFIYDSLLGDVTIPDGAATRLLLSIKDSDKPGDRQLSDVVSLSDKYITASVPRLLTIYDPGNKVYEIGRKLFYGQLVLGADMISGSPLETAYFWTLACRSALSQKIEFLPSHSYIIYCIDLVPGHIFLQSDSSVYNLDFLKNGIMYFTDERVGGKPSHPLADLFFITETNELVLVDVYGGMSKKMLKEKSNNLAVWIVAEQPKITQYSLRGVVLAPNVNIESKNIGDVLTVSGLGAVRLLGGLKQIVKWFE